MARKKNKSYTNHFVFHTRTGFYAVSVIAVLLLINTIQYFSPPPNTQGVLGENDENHGKNESREEKREKEEKREEKNEEIKREFKIETDGLKVNFRQKDGKVERQVFADEDLDLDEDEENELADEIENEFEEEHHTEIASDSSGVIIQKGKIKARTGFPLSIDLATNQLIVTRPDGTTKIVTVLPDQAIANFMKHKKVNLINVPTNPVGSGSANTGGNNSGSVSAGTGDGNIVISTDSSAMNEDETQVSLTERKGILVYEIKGKKKLKVLGFIPVNVNTTGYVSADTGAVVDQEESFWTQILNFISI